MSRKNKKAALKIGACKCGAEITWRTTPRLRCDACRRIAILEDKARYRTANRASMREKNLEYMRANAESMNAKQRARRRANPAKHKEQNDKWRRANPLKHAIQFARYRARKAGAEGNFTDADFVCIIENQDRKCFYCSTDISGKATIDHYIPFLRGGSNWSANIVAACKSCNTKKRNRMPYDFKAERCDQF